MKRALAAVTAAGALTVALSGCAGSPAGQGPAVSVPRHQSPSHAPTTSTPAYRPGTRPASFSVPAIQASSTLEPLERNSDGTLEVPSVHTPKQAGWYEPGPEPGQPGPAVIVGHVDGDHIEGVFWKLKDVKAGDEVDVTLTDKTKLKFTVYQTEVAPKDKFPAGKVFGYAAKPELRLVTCGGAFDRSARSYKSNVIVYARLTT